MKYIITISFLTILFTSCFVDPIELDLNEQNEKIVILGWITDLPEPQFIKISKTVNYLGDIPEVYVGDAEVIISDSQNTYTLEERTTGFYYLPLDWQARIGDTYKLEVTYKNVEYNASYTMASCPEIEEAKTIQDGFIDDQDSITAYETVFAFQEKPGEGDAYFAIDYLEGTLDGDSLSNGGYANDEFIDGEYFEDIMISENDRRFREGETAVIELYSIGNDAADYLFDIEAETFRGGPFDPPPANVRTNISGGALGFFIASGAKQVKLMVQ